ncbi:MAG: SH3 domain-containing protein, partial [Oscillospiraceae bacterium]|nr:SH3 domain-containing protein [Oscillospiraceae bacterium]
VNNLRGIYPLPDQVTTRATTTLGEVRDSKFPANLLELGYHDNYEDARWIENNITEIARNLVMSLTDYFDIPFIWPTDPWEGTVQAGGSTLNLRSRPSTSASVVTSIPNGARVRVYGRYGDWYVVRYGDYTGYAAAQYIQ